MKTSLVKVTTTTTNTTNFRTAESEEGSVTEQQTIGHVEPFVTVDEMARELRLSRVTVLRRIGAGAFPGAYRDGRQHRIPQSARLAYLKRTGALASDDPATTTIN